MKTKNLLEVTDLIKSGRVGVMPTDTIYGIVGSALNPDSVERIYDIRKRNKNKPMIILISSISDLDKFNTELPQMIKNKLEMLWPNPLSVIFNVKGEEFEYLHRGTNSLAYRIPNNSQLLKLISDVGPIVAPSANFEGEVPAKTINEAENYFGDEVDFYVDWGKLQSNPSTLIKFEDNSPVILRQGAFELPKNL